MSDHGSLSSPSPLSDTTSSQTTSAKNGAYRLGPGVHVDGDREELPSDKLWRKQGRLPRSRWVERLMVLVVLIFLGLLAAPVVMDLQQRADDFALAAQMDAIGSLHFDTSRGGFHVNKPPVITRETLSAHHEMVRYWFLFAVEHELPNRLLFASRGWCQEPKHGLSAAQVAERYAQHTLDEQVRLWLAETYEYGINIALDSSVPSNASMGRAVLAHKDYAQRERLAIIHRDGHLQQAAINRHDLPLSPQEVMHQGEWTTGIGDPHMNGGIGTAKDRWFCAETAQELSWQGGSRRTGICFR